MSIKSENQQDFFEHLFWNILSSFILVALLFLLDYFGIKGYVFQSVILLLIAWCGFFFYPLFLLWKPSAILFSRFMKDTPMLFPTIFFVMMLQPLFLGSFTVVDGGVLISEFNESFFYLTFMAVLIFASNCHKLFAIIFSTKSFQLFYIKCIRKLRPKKSDKEIIDAFDPKKNSNYETEIKNLTYVILCYHIFVVIVPLIILLIIFQEVIVIPMLAQFFGTLIFISGAFMSIGGLRIFISSFESFIKKKYKISV